MGGTTVTCSVRLLARSTERPLVAVQAAECAPISTCEATWLAPKG
jgi:hypothetical protein